jgi:hypothetical protein
MTDPIISVDSVHRANFYVTHGPRMAEFADGVTQSRGSRLMGQ